MFVLCRNEETKSNCSLFEKHEAIFLFASSSTPLVVDDKNTEDSMFCWGALIPIPRVRLKLMQHPIHLHPNNQMQEVI